jgi:DNA mismatch repair protein MutS2
MERLKAKQDRKKNRKNGTDASGAPTPSTSPTSPKPAEAPKVRPIEAGETVRIKGQTAVGEVTAVNGRNAQVTFGNLKTTVALARLERAAAPTAAQKPIAKSTFVSAETQDRVYEKKLAFKQDIDVRGMRGDEAIQAVTYFIDDAILLGISRVRILHGTGSGILRTLIRDYLSGVPGVKHFQDEHVQFGGAGITVVDLE